MEYYKLLLFLSFISTIVYAQVGYSNLINIGPNYYSVGINTPDTTYNIIDPSNATDVLMILQQALDDIGINGGGIVHIQAGFYIISGNLNISGSKTHMQGDGMNQTIIQLMDFAPSFISGHQQKAGLVRAHYLHDIILSNMTIDGNKYNQNSDNSSVYGRYGVFTEGCANVWFDTVAVTNCQGYGFDPHGWKSQHIWAEYLTISNCVSMDNDWDGFTIDQTYNAFITNCTSVNNGRHGYNIVTGSKYIVIENNIAIVNGYYDNHVNSTGGCGFMIQNNFLLNTSDVLLNNNYVSGNFKAGFCLNDVYNIEIVNNLIKAEYTCMNISLDNSTYDCVKLINVSAVLVHQNECDAYKFLAVYNSTVSNSTLNYANVYSYDNIFNKIPICGSNTTGTTGRINTTGTTTTGTTGITNTTGTSGTTGTTGSVSSSATTMFTSITTSHPVSISSDVSQNSAMSSDTNSVQADGISITYFQTYHLIIGMICVFIF